MPDQKVFVISHSWFFKLWTGVWNQKFDLLDEWIPDPDESTWMLNCEFIPDDINFPQHKSIDHPDFPDRHLIYDIPAIEKSS